MKLATTILAASLLASTSLAQAAADFATLRSASSLGLNDTTPSRVINFTLPATVSTSSYSVLDFEVLGSEFNYNEIYVNPPTTVCTSDSTDANQSGSVGYLQEHDDDNLKTEWATNHIVFPSSKLLAGANKVLICVRSAAGNAGNGAGNIDDISVRSMVLHYHNTQ